MEPMYQMDAVFPLLWAKAFLLTQIVEIPIYVAAQQGNPALRFLRAFFASAITHPIVWFGIVLHWPAQWGGYWGMVGAAEGFAILGEALFFFLTAKKSMKIPIVWSIVANGLSVGIGLLLSHIEFLAGCNCTGPS